MNDETIVALSSGSLPSGVAVIRISGSACQKIAEGTLGCILEPRVAYLKSVKDPSNNEELDRGLVIFFKAPASFTGEDCLELQLHACCK